MTRVRVLLVICLLTPGIVACSDQPDVKRRFICELEKNETRFPHSIRTRDTVVVEATKTGNQMAIEGKSANITFALQTDESSHVRSNGLVWASMGPSAQGSIRGDTWLIV